VLREGGEGERETETPKGREGEGRKRKGRKEEKGKKRKEAFVLQGGFLLHYYVVFLCVTIPLLAIFRSWTFVFVPLSCIIEKAKKSVICAVVFLL
jgi:hypothetical protein